MPLDTDLNVSPFWDDYAEEKNYHRVLFRPRVPVQARELTQLQTILQNQIERFGENIFKEGTIVKGCAFTYDDKYFYAKVRDLQVDGQPVNASQFANTIVRNSANISALVLSTADGLESQNPDLNTLYIKYLNAGANGQTFFVAGEVLDAFDRDYGVQRVNVDVAGVGYSNTDTVVFTSNTGSGAVARLVTNNVGAISEVVITAKGESYLVAPTVAIANSIGGASLGSGATLTADNKIAQLTIAPGSFATGNTSYEPVGIGYAFRVNDGVIFQKGFFVRVDPQEIVVSKYTTSPDGVSVGFTTSEAIVNNNVDTSLLDNAQGVANFNAPGAFRLKLTPNLTLKTTAEAAASNNFFSLVDFSGGAPTRQRQTTEYSTIGNEMAKRSSEESGDYVVEPFSVIAESISGNTTHLQARIGAGLAYVDGYRIEQTSTSSLPVRKGTNIIERENVAIATNYSNYVNVNTMTGTFPFNVAATVSLRDTVGTTAASGAGTQIGTARVRSVQFDSGTPGDPAAVYRLYIFDIRMSAGKAFSDVRSIFYNGGSTAANGFANPILESSKAVVKEPNFNQLVFRFGQKATKTLRNLAGNNDIDFTYSTVDTGVSFSANGVFQKNLTGTEAFPYSGVLNEVEERDFIIVARATANSASAGAGTVAINSGSNTVTGTSTSFLSYYSVNDYVAFGASGGTRRITNIANNTSMSLDSNPAATSASTTHIRTYPQGAPIPISNRSNRTITVSGQQLTVNLGESLSGTLPVTAVYNVRRSTALQLTKNYRQTNYVKLNTDVVGTSGPWCLGIPDGFQLLQVLKTGSSDYTSGAQDVTKHFILDSGQKDSHYGLAWLRKNPAAPLQLDSSQRLLVKFSSFTYTTTGGGVGFFSVDSYPVDDTAGANTAVTIRTEQIPVYTASSGDLYDLRDSVDFRPVVDPTAALANTVGAATENPSSTEVFAATDKYFPTPNKLFNTSLQYYLGRYDKLVLNSYGNFTMVEGTASENPAPAHDVNGAMTLATLYIPPYPTLGTKAGTEARRPSYTVKTTIQQNRRYTMVDIGKLDKRLQQVEYYTSLNLLEKNTKDLLIPSAVDGSLDRFKNGIFVDPFNDFNIGNVADGEFTAGIDEVNGELVPRFRQNKFDLQVANSVGVYRNGDLVTMAYNSTPVISQAFATRVRNCTDSYWNFTGKMTLTPSYDNFYDVSKNPENTIIDVDNASSTLSLVNQLNSVKALNKVQSTTIADSTGATTGAAQAGLSTTTTTTDYTINAAVSTTTKKVGDFVTDISFSAYMRAQPIKFSVLGLKPNSTIYAFFDKVAVSAFCQPCNSAGVPTGLLGTPLKVDATGNLNGIFYLPASTFFVGDRDFLLMDVDAIASQSAATTKAVSTFHAYNFSADKSSVVISTRSVEIDIDSTSTTTTTKTTSQTPEVTQTIVNNITIISPPDPNANTQPSTNTTPIDTGTPPVVVDPPTPPVVVNPPDPPVVTPDLTPNAVSFSNVVNIVHTDSYPVSATGNSVTISGISQPIVLGFTFSNTEVWATGQNRYALITAYWMDPEGNSQATWIFHTPSNNSYAGPEWGVGGDNRFANIAMCDTHAQIAVANGSYLYFDAGTAATGKGVTAAGQPYGGSHTNGSCAATLKLKVNVINLSDANTVLGSFDVDVEAWSSLFPGSIVANNQSYTPVAPAIPATGGYGGYGTNCPAPETLILMANGLEKRADQLKVGDMVFTQHQDTFEWGSYEVVGVQADEAERWRVCFEDGRHLIATPNHRLATGEGVWLELKELSVGDEIMGSRPAVVSSIEPYDTGSVMKVTVENAHTYISNGILSHNIKMLENIGLIDYYL